MQENQLYLDFFTKVLQRILSKNPTFTSAHAKPQPYFSTGIGRGGFLVFCEFKGEKRDPSSRSFRVGLFLDTKDKEKNNKIFSTLVKFGPLIEKGINQKLEWLEPNHTLIWSKSAKRERKIFVSIHGNIYSRPEKIEELINFAVAYLKRFKEFFSFFLGELNKLPHEISQVVKNEGIPIYKLERKK
jgi:hypothetical protein